MQLWGSGCSSRPGHCASICGPPASRFRGSVQRDAPVLGVAHPDDCGDDSGNGGEDQQGSTWHGRVPYWGSLVVVDDWGRRGGQTWPRFSCPTTSSAATRHRRATGCGLVRASAPAGAAAGSRTREVAGRARRTPRRADPAGDAQGSRVGSLTGHGISLSGQVGGFADR